MHAPAISPFLSRFAKSAARALRAASQAPRLSRGSIWSPSRQIMSPDEDRPGRRSKRRGRFDPRNLGSYGLFPAQRTCKCCNYSLNDCPACLTVTISGTTPCPENECRVSCSNGFSYRLTSIPDINGTYVVDGGGITSTCTYGGPLWQLSFEEYEEAGCVNLRRSVTDDVTLQIRFNRTTGKITSLAVFRNGGGEGFNAFFGYAFLAIAHTDQGLSCGTGGLPLFTTIPNIFTECPSCDCGMSATTNRLNTHYGGTIHITSCCPCDHCEGCAAPLSCPTAPLCPSSNSCTPDVIRATLSGITVTQTCVTDTGVVKSWRLDGSTAVNRTVDLRQISQCTWQARVASNHVLRRFALLNCLSEEANFTSEELVYQLTRVSSSSWEWEVYGADSGVKRTSFVGATSASCAMNPFSYAATANSCVPATATHPTRTACANAATTTSILGSGGSTTFTVCP
jgi:hypothetical protein